MPTRSMSDWENEVRIYYVREEEEEEKRRMRNNPVDGIGRSLETPRV